MRVTCLKFCCGKVARNHDQLEAKVHLLQSRAEDLLDGETADENSAYSFKACMRRNIRNVNGYE